jgi:hypothetical protein
MQISQTCCLSHVRRHHCPGDDLGLGAAEQAFPVGAGRVVHELLGDDAGLVLRQRPDDAAEVGVVRQVVGHDGGPQAAMRSTGNFMPSASARVCMRP